MKCKFLEKTSILQTLIKKFKGTASIASAICNRENTVRLSENIDSVEDT